MTDDPTRLLSGQAEFDDLDDEVSLRPLTFDDYIGQWLTVGSSDFSIEVDYVWTIGVKIEFFVGVFTLQFESNRFHDTGATQSQISSAHNKLEPSIFPGH